jgi:hypothetical protein
LQPGDRRQAWFWDPKDGDHTPIVYALEGTPDIAVELDRILEGDPKRGLDALAAQRIQGEFDRRLKLYIAPGPLAATIHKDVAAGSQLLALTGTIAEHDGRRWISVQKVEPARVRYPAKMLAPDRPLVAAGDKPIVLRVSDALTLNCDVLPAGRFLQGSPFYQRRYQDEYPHEVVLSRPFAMFETPVTREMFEAVLGKNPSPRKGPRLPVERRTRTAWSSAAGSPTTTA